MSKERIQEVSGDLDDMIPSAPSGTYRCIFVKYLSTLPYQRVQYCQEVWMKPEEFDRINAILDDSIADEIESYIDVMDVLDAEDFQDVELMLLKESVVDGK